MKMLTNAGHESSGLPFVFVPRVFMFYFAGAETNAFPLPSLTPALLPWAVSIINTIGIEAPFVPKALRGRIPVNIQSPDPS